ncbi:copper-containing nitrite reductase [Natronobacterium texcoconense]|uniref:Copper-containing nitrite reductase n=1 Tax=Natronobacterium texcoconense TaxID=1095778 RepID=A0A1H1AVA6_NATTX|nr:copper-containing nitrite reductase [Natronobacterium texcoconense]SDQ43617.1 nitrite reductase (NO-forming) [Natronobacterium texcoconense]
MSPTDHNKRRRRFLQTVGVAGAAALAGCFGDSGTDADDSGSNGNSNSNGNVELPPPEEPEVDTIAADPTDVPDPVDWDSPRTHEIRIQTEEYVAEIEPGVTTRFMTFEGQVPGPMYRVRVGDTVRLTFDVPEDLNRDVHNIDFHAVYGPGGGAVDTTIAPGEGEETIEFQATYPGAHIYHCAPGNHDQHISLGMFGTILVEPEDGLPEVDREFYIGQHELYLEGETGQEGHHAFDFDEAASEDPTYVLFNGEVGRFTEDGAAGPLHAEVGETVRVFWCNGGPNLTSGPHPIGNVWTEWYRDGDVLSDPAQYVEGTAQAAGTTAFGTMDMEVPGPIFLVDHALSRVNRKGLMATINVEGEEDPDIYNPDP